MWDVSPGWDDFAYISSALGRTCVSQEVSICFYCYTAVNDVSEYIRNYSVKYLVLKTDRFFHWHDQVNNIAFKLNRIETNIELNRANVFLLKIRSYVC